MSASRASRRAAATAEVVRLGWVGGGTAQLGDQARQRQRPRGAALVVLGLSGAQLVEEPRRLLAVVVGRRDRGDDQTLAGAGAAT